MNILEEREREIDKKEGWETGRQKGRVRHGKKEKQING